MNMTINVGGCVHDGHLLNSRTLAASHNGLRSDAVGYVHKRKIMSTFSVRGPILLHDRHPQTHINPKRSRKLTSVISNEISAFIIRLVHGCILSLLERMSSLLGLSFYCLRCSLL
jgi:hypothetical protein